MTKEVSPHRSLPVIIIGAGISGLLLAQQLLISNISFLIFERDDDLRTRGVGWGLTLHWSLPALRQLLPKELLAQLPNTYVDPAAVARGESSSFPFFDLSTGELKSSSPKASVDHRIRVTRERLRRLLATGVDIQWGRSFQGFHENGASVTAFFEDGSKCQGRMILGCDGSHSRVRQTLLPHEYKNYQIPIRMLGFTMRVSVDEARPIRELDPFFLQGTASASNSFMFVSLLESLDEGEHSDGAYVYQVCISWNTDIPSFHETNSERILSTNEGRINIIKWLAKDWVEPFCSFASLIPNSATVKQLDLDDFSPHIGIQPAGTVMLMGDALHAMTMYRGEGANHAIMDVLDFKEKVLPHLEGSFRESSQVAMRDFGDGVVARTRPAVLASRQACLDAHDWHGLSSTSPLLTRRQMMLDFGG